MPFKSSRSWETFRDVISLLRQDASGFVQARLLIALLLIIAASILTALGPVALQMVVDRFAGQSAGTVSIATLIGGYVLSQWLARTAGEIRGLLYARAERRMARALGERLFAHIMRLPLRFHMERRTGAISQILDNGLNGYERVIYTMIFTVLPVAAELATIIAVLSRLNHPVFLLFFGAAFVTYLFAFTYAAKTITSAARDASQSQINATSTMTDSLLNYEAIKFFTAERVVEERVRSALIETEERWVGFYRRYAYNGLGIGTIFAGFLALTVTFAAREVQAGHLTIGAFVLVNTYMLQIVRPVELLGYAMQNLSQGVAFLQKMVEILREVPEQAEAEKSRPLDGPGRLEFVGIAHSYATNRDVLRNVSFSVPAGQTLGIVGSSGTGKSTIVRLLVRLVEPNSGRILIDGIPISDISLKALRQSIAIVPQDTVLFNDTIKYNIAFGKEGCTQSEIEHAARLAHLHDFIMSLPEGYDTQVGERGIKLSGGERQRVSIARAAIKRPSIYVFDEATSSLDSHTEREILKNIGEISRLSTTLVIAHRLSTVVHASEIIVLNEGTVAERGTHETLLLLNGRYAHLWEAQHAGHAGARQAS